ncbi:hypothetical protein FN846DRAFT_887584 [Sphaerosporella brunnea]|uniref:Uncharacterized protein n=1 Tax=Sphaerosporella brunnea TaxID=1250544 RepID=A0A5J5F5Y4_9PEZI|nr:hypothetical protein FN846DRAFT_887584 [Sphaerosporella brunnea]
MARSIVHRAVTVCLSCAIAGARTISVESRVKSSVRNILKLASASVNYNRIPRRRSTPVPIGPNPFKKLAASTVKPATATASSYLTERLNIACPSQNAVRDSDDPDEPWFWNQVTAIQINCSEAQRSRDKENRAGSVGNDQSADAITRMRQAIIEAQAHTNEIIAQLNGGISTADTLCIEEEWFCSSVFKLSASAQKARCDRRAVRLQQRSWPTHDHASLERHT